MKQANGQGSVTKRASGGWEARFSYVDAAGRRQRVSSYGKTQAEARAKMNEKRKRIESGHAVKDSSETLGDFASRWSQTTLRQPTRKESTQATYEAIVRNRIENAAIGRIPLNKLTPSDIEGMIAELASPKREGGPLSAATIRQTYSVVRAVLATALRDKLITRNVAEDVKRPRVKHKDARFLTPDELRRLLSVAEGTRHAPVFKLLAYTGLRRGEALALRWRDVDLDGGLLRVRGTLARAGSGPLKVTEPKSERSRRTLPISAPVAEVLTQRRKQQADEQARAGNEWHNPDGYIFTTDTGGFVEPGNLLRALKVSAEHAGLKGVKLHSLRHSAASAMLGAGVPLRAVSDLLGHSSIAITADIYGQLAPEVRRSAADRLAEALG